MNSFELNKVLGAILGTCLVLLALNIGAGAIFAPEKPAKPGYAIAVKAQGEGEQPAAKEPEQPIETLLASASVEKGQTTAKQCQACHTFDKGGPNRVGPNLYGIVGRPRASEAGFNYSAAMKAKGGTWTYDELNKFLTHPQGYIAGHGHDLCRSVARNPARRRHRLPEYFGGQSSSAAEGGASRSRARCRGSARRAGRSAQAGGSGSCAGKVIAAKTSF